MATHISSWQTRALLHAPRAAQVTWLLFVLLALSMALPGIAIYTRALQTVCHVSGCLANQLTAAEARAVLAIPMSLQQYAEQQIYLYLFSAALLLATSAVLIWRRSNNRAAVLGAFILASLATGSLAQAYAQSVPVLELTARIIQIVPIAGLLPFFCLIPDGHFRPGWLRWAAVAAVPVGALTAYDVLDPPAQIAFGGMLGVLIVGSLVHRYRSLPASPQQEQAAWALAAFALLAAAQCIGRPLRPLPMPAVPLDVVSHANIWFLSFIGMMLMVGALTCLAVALLNDELFRVEVILNRALVYGMLTLLIVGGYVVVVGYLSLLFQSSGNLWFSLVATGLVAVLFQPARQRVQRFVNQLIYGERDDPYHVIAQLGQRLRAAFEPSAALTMITQTVREALKLPYVAIALEHGGASQIAAASGSSFMEPIHFPLIYQGAQVGQLLVNPRRGDTTLAPADRALLADLAQQASIAVYGFRLLADLQHMTTDLQHSRQRLVLAREEERRRLRNDLHDDLAPTLAGLSLTASTITDLIPIDPAKATALAEGLHTEMRDAVGNIRRLVYDLRPPTLDDLGLLAAIRERAAQYSGHQNGANSLQVVVEAPETLPPLPAAVEVAAYRIVQEALMNVVKHASARTCRIRIATADGAAGLCLEIADDGVGLPETPVQGVGLRSMQERAVELGGRCEIGPVTERSHAEGRGTRILVSLPIENEAAHEPTSHTDR